MEDEESKGQSKSIHFNKYDLSFLIAGQTNDQYRDALVAFA